MADLQPRVLIYKPAQVQVSDPNFQRSTIRPIAISLAAKLSIILIPQPRAFGIQRPREGTHDAFKNRMSAALTDIFTEALIVRGQIQVAASEFNLIWFPTGSQYDEETMIVAPPNRGDHGEIAFCVVPCPMFIESPEREWLVASKAFAFRKVITVG